MGDDESGPEDLKDDLDLECETVIWLTSKLPIRPKSLPVKQVDLIQLPASSEIMKRQKISINGEHE